MPAVCQLHSYVLPCPICTGVAQPVDNVAAGLMEESYAGPAAFPPPTAPVTEVPPGPSFAGSSGAEVAALKAEIGRLGGLLNASEAALRRATADANAKGDYWEAKRETEELRGKVGQVLITLNQTNMVSVAREALTSLLTPPGDPLCQHGKPVVAGVTDCEKCTKILNGED